MEQNNKFNLFKNKLRDIAIKYSRFDGAHDILHFDRVWNNSKLIIKNDNLKADLYVVCAACYLHDIKQLSKDDVNNYKSSTIAADYAQNLIIKYFPDITNNQLDNISIAIKAHSYSANISATTLEAKIVQDADRLDSLGAIGIARLFYTAGIMGTSLYSPEEHTLDDKKYAIDHFMTKVIKIPSLMHSDYAIKVGHERLEFIELYINNFMVETNTKLETKDTV